MNCHFILPFLYVCILLPGYQIHALPYFPLMRIFNGCKHGVYAISVLHLEGTWKLSWPRILLYWNKVLKVMVGRQPQILKILKGKLFLFSCLTIRKRRIAKQLCSLAAGRHNRSSERYLLDRALTAASASNSIISDISFPFLLFVRDG